MDREKVKRLLNERATLQNAKEEIIDFLVKAGFNRRNISVRGKTIRHDLLNASLFFLDIVNGKLTVKIQSSFTAESICDELKNLAMKNGWAIKRV